MAKLENDFKEPLYALQSVRSSVLSCFLSCQSVRHVVWHLKANLSGSKGSALSPTGSAIQGGATSETSCWNTTFAPRLPSLKTFGITLTRGTDLMCTNGHAHHGNFHLA
mmetsp:Transcript_2337/g.7151  ORF Transcript_2337/g.7151 Transcript_2337/m.7151 type:complete len:109 (+) Transcript_2337:425-751(+)